MQKNQHLNLQKTEDEMSKAVNSLKSSGVDKKMNEHINEYIYEMFPIYLQFSNIIFDSGQIPTDWTKSIITLPIF